MGRTEPFFRDGGLDADYWVDHAPPEPAPGAVERALPEPAVQHVLHIAGRVTGAVFSFLGPTLHALDRAGVRQTLVLLDWPECRAVLADVPPSVNVVAVPTQRSVWRNWAELAHRVEGLFRSPTAGIDTVHLHGLMPFLLGGRLGTKFPSDVTTFFTPHGSRSMELLRGLRNPLMRQMGKQQPLRVIVNSPSDASMLRSSSIKPMLVESPVETEYFAVDRRESKSPMVVSGSALEDMGAVEMFSRLAVVLGAAELNLRFSWLGDASLDARAQLKAAGVEKLESTSAEQQAQCMAAAWLFIAAEGTRDFPVMLSCAMAAGLPCLATDTPNHRDLIRHGETGYIYGSQSEALQLLTMLLDDHALRHQLGRAARADAASRFRMEYLDHAIRRAYGT